MLLYNIEFKEHSLLVKLAEEGVRRILYLDTLKSIAKEADKEALGFLTKIHLRIPNANRNADTLSFQQIEVSQAQSWEALKLLAKTGRLFFKGKKLVCDLQTPAKVYWKGEKHSEKACTVGAYLQYKGEEIPLEQCEVAAPFCFIKNSHLASISGSIGWKWVERFLKGPVLLEGMDKKRFLEEEPPVLWKEMAKEKSLEVFPLLKLSDATGCFADLWMNYGDLGEIAFPDMAPHLKGRARLKEVEKQWEKDLLESGFLRKQVGGSQYYCPSEKVKETLLLLLSVGWEIRDFRGRRVKKQSGTAIEIGEKGGKIAVRGSVRFQEEPVSLQKAMQGRMWVDLNEGSVGLIDKVERFEGEWEEDVLLLNKHRIHSLVPLLESPEVEWSETIRRAAEGLKNGAGIELSLPGPGFKGTLLPYQQKGVDWLSFLYEFGFSGLLADEMGLGKTVQVLAFFSRLGTKLPILIVAPSSLLYNWRSEIERFLGREVYLHAGADRISELSDLQLFDCILTSYAILRLDVELLSRISFEVVVLDESNAIKTASTQNAQAAYRLNSRFRIALSGTPIENRPEELASQFRFLLPGLQGSLDKKKVRPFILRRRKEEVQIELPEKMEQIIWVEMGESQRAAYESYKAGISWDGQKNRMEILEKILRLRQICCDPRLVGAEGESGKMELLLQDLEEAVEEKRKVLVYSQFTSMLGLIAQELRKRGWNFLMLDGSTPLTERAEAVDSFQTDPDAFIFLLSLKAGGVGLNLTAAETVFLFDPWWNFAVEQQAIDRAHRIGQKKTVIAKRYLVPGSIEEKMLKLKEKKQSASAEILDGGDTSWTEAELLELLS